MWFSYTLIILLLLGTGLTLGRIDQPRKPTTAGDALFSVVLNVGVVIGIIHYYL